MSRPHQGPKWCRLATIPSFYAYFPYSCGISARSGLPIAAGPAKPPESGVETGPLLNFFVQSSTDGWGGAARQVQDFEHGHSPRGRGVDVLRPEIPSRI